MCEESEGQKTKEIRKKRLWKGEQEERENDTDKESAIVEVLRDLEVSFILFITSTCSSATSNIKKTFQT